jgi:hypothetical protein
LPSAKVFETTCAKLFKTVTPQKTTTMVEKRTYKCVVDYVCGKCGSVCGGNNNPQPTATSKAAQPADQAKFPYWAP